MKLKEKFNKKDGQNKKEKKAVKTEDPRIHEWKISQKRFLQRYDQCDFYCDRDRDQHDRRISAIQIHRI